ncbi:TPA: hypothetical protein N0F65_003494, partial [Lagenidium giganteum]
MDSSQLKLARLPSLSELTKLEEQPYEEFLNDLKRGDVAEVVLLRSEAELSELNTSSVMDTTVLDEEAIAAFKARFDARRGSAILKNPRDRYYDLVKRFSETCRGVRHEIDQILMKDRGIPLTAVSTPSGMLWEWRVMPQGL